MSSTVNCNCLHPGSRRRWLGVRQTHGRPVLLFQCLECGKTFSAHAPMTMQQETEQFVRLSRFSRA